MPGRKDNSSEGKPETPRHFTSWNYRVLSVAALEGRSRGPVRSQAEERNRGHIMKALGVHSLCLRRRRAIDSFFVRQ